MSNWAATVSITKGDNDEQRLASGWASIVTTADGTPIVDSQGDIIPITELEKAVHDAFTLGGLGKVGDMHERQGLGSVVASYPLTAKKREKFDFGRGLEGWMVDIRVHDDRLWDMIKRGERLELSLRGTAERVPV